MGYKKKGFGAYHKWFMDAEKIYRQLFTAEQMGRLHFAVMKYVETGEREEVDSDIRFAYMDQCMKSDVAHAAYKEISAMRAENGSYGGKAKARNKQRNAADPGEKQTKEKPYSMTKTDFMDVFKKLKHDDLVEGAPADVTGLRERLAEAGWKIGNVPFTDRCQIETLLKLYFAKAEYNIAPRWFSERLLAEIANDERFHAYKYTWDDEPGGEVQEYSADMNDLLDFFWDSGDDCPLDWLCSYTHPLSVRINGTWCKNFPEIINKLFAGEMEDKIVIDSND